MAQKLGNSDTEAVDLGDLSLASCDIVLWLVSELEKLSITAEEGVEMTWVTGVKDPNLINRNALVDHVWVYPGTGAEYFIVTNNCDSADDDEMDFEDLNPSDPSEMRDFLLGKARLAEESQVSNETFRLEPVEYVGRTDNNWFALLDEMEITCLNQLETDPWRWVSQQSGWVQVSAIKHFEENCAISICEW